MLVTAPQNRPLPTPAPVCRTVEPVCCDRDDTHQPPHPERVTLFTVGPRPFWVYLERLNIEQATLARAESAGTRPHDQRSARTAADAPAVRAERHSDAARSRAAAAAYARPLNAAPTRAGSIIDATV